MAVHTIRTQPRASSRTDLGNEARQGVEFAQNEVLRAQKHVAAITAHYQQQIETAQSWLRETQRRLRCALMIQRRLDPEVVAEPVDTAPWLPAIAPSSLSDWQRRVTLDESRLHEDD